MNSIIYAAYPCTVKFDLCRCNFRIFILGVSWMEVVKFFAPGYPHWGLN